MEKLIELLNEYRNKELWYNVLEWEEHEIWVSEDKLISKRFGFIEWLVKNKKIDEKKIDTRLVKYVESYYDEEWYWMENSYEDYSCTNTLLMILAISDTPIDDLISYLK